MGSGYVSWDAPAERIEVWLQSLFEWKHINSLRMLKDTLEMVHFDHCNNVEGEFMCLADFPRLKWLNLKETAVRGDIRNISEDDFVSMESLVLPKAVYGAGGYELQRVSDGPELIRTLYLLKKQRPALLDITDWYGQLSTDSPDWYETDTDVYSPPFYIRFVKAGSRLGYQWLSDCFESPSEVNWLDPEPDRESSDYQEYMEELTWIENKVDIYRGFYQPPTEYYRLE